jgi:arylsulfatase A-like enzyme
MPKRPNIIVYFTDQQRADTTGAHGSKLGLTPNFDRMARRGTHVFNSFTCQPVCGPARSCLQTGRYATQTGVWRNGLQPHAHLKMLGTYFGEAGYQTGYIGKWHLMSHGHPGPVPPEARGGYDYWLAANLLEFVSGPYDTNLWDRDGNRHHLPGYRVDALTDAAIRFISDQAGDEAPFFLFLSHLEPHHQNHSDNYPAPLGYEETYADAALPPDLRAGGGSAPQHWPGYCGMVKRCDEALGRMLDALESLGLADDTLVLFTSDHGCHFKTRNDEYKRSCHEASIRVPTAICGPGFEGGGRLEQLCSLIDLPPTLLDAAGIEVPADMMGRSIKSLVADRGQPWPDDVLVQISESHTGRCVRTSRWKYSVRAVTATGERPSQEGPGSAYYADDFLYDLDADPWEQNNLIGRRAFVAVTAEMRTRLVARMTACGEAAPRFIDAPSVPSGQRRPGYADPENPIG